MRLRKLLNTTGLSLPSGLLASYSLLLDAARLKELVVGFASRGNGCRPPILLHSVSIGTSIFNRVVKLGSSC